MAEEGGIVLPHPFRLEYGRIHDLQIGGDFRGKLHLRQNIFCKSMPGAISVRTTFPFSSLKTARSVT